MNDPQRSSKQQNMSGNETEGDRHESFNKGQASSLCDSTVTTKAHFNELPIACHALEGLDQVAVQGERIIGTDLHALSTQTGTRTNKQTDTDKQTSRVRLDPYLTFMGETSYVPTWSRDREGFQIQLKILNEPVPRGHKRDLPLQHLQGAARLKKGNQLGLKCFDYPIQSEWLGKRHRARRGHIALHQCFNCK